MVVDIPPEVEKGQLVLVDQPTALLQNRASLGIVLVLPRLHGPQEVHYLCTRTESEKETQRIPLSPWKWSDTHRNIQPRLITDKQQVKTSQ